MTKNLTEENFLPEKISNIPFQELHEFKSQYGMRIYNEILNGKRVPNQDCESHRKKGKQEREMSSKIPPFKNLMKIVEKNFTSDKPRDPRFHSAYGNFDQKKFEKNYEFLNDLKKKERKMLKNKLRNLQIEDEERNKIRKTLQRMDNQTKEEIRKEKEGKIKKEERQYEIDQLKQGRKPEYCTKSDEKLLNLVRKFETMKEKGGLQKHIKRRRKKTIIKDKNKLRLIN